MDPDLFSPEYRNRKKRQSSGLFGWTVFILLLVAFALACWVGTYYIFTRPENPESYGILKKLKKIEVPVRFELTKAPQGEFLTAQKMFDRFGTMSRLDLQRQNESFIRAYIRNYDSTKLVVPYVVGRYTILSIHELTPQDWFPSGIVALAQSVDQPQIVIEHVFTADESVVPSLKKLLQPGLDIRLERTLDLSAILNVRKLQSGHIVVTCIPLLYGSYQMRQGSGRFSLSPPPDMNPAGGFPIIKSAQFEEALKLATNTPKKPVQPTFANNPSATPSPSQAPELVRLETPTPSPTASETATPALAAASPSATPKPTSKPSGTPAVLAANSTPTPRLTPRLTPTPSVTPAPSASPAEGVKLEPFLTAVATPATGIAAGRSWRTYDAGRMPLGRLIGVNEAAELAEKGVGGETVYLRGDFAVTASGEYQAVLRPQGNAVTNVLNRGNRTRVIVEFPVGSTPPTEGSNFSRDQQRPFQITDVRRGEDGQLNIYVREVTKP